MVYQQFPRGFTDVRTLGLKVITTVYSPLNNVVFKGSLKTVLLNLVTSIGSGI